LRIHIESWGGLTDVMNLEYEAFCIVDPHFYDKPGRGRAPEHFAAAQRPAPDGWQRRSDDHWAIYFPVDHRLPGQGWKVHVSGRPENAERIIDVVWDYCMARGTAFKFLCSRMVVLARNSKYAGRGGSGKLVTIYPVDEAEMELVCKELDEALAGEDGPYILSDLRWRAGPVHVRYGGFAHRYCRDERGESVLAIEDASGTLVPDVRGPVFSVPPWVSVPDALAPHLAARSATTVADIPYDITEALHFSNGGGVYAGRDKRSGAKVVFKEGRPHAGLSGDGSDAVTRLRRERDTLDRLKGVPAVPDLLDSFTVGDHEFLVMEFVEGEPLKAVLAQRYPLLDGTPDPGDLADYAAWAQGLHARVESAVADIHARGVVYGDLHMFNVIVRPDGDVALIDFEVADTLGSGRRGGLGAVGFAAPRDWAGADVDRYALACLRLALFLPVQPLLGLDRDKAAELADVAAATFPVPRAWFDDAVALITAPAGGPGSPGGAPHAEAADRRAGSGRPAGSRVAPTVPAGGRPALVADGTGWERARASLVAGIAAAATPERTDRLFPGDIAQFRSGSTGGLNLAHGAAGVLYALDATGAAALGEHPEWQDWQEWLVRGAEAPGDEPRFGFYDGLGGVAHVLARLGHVEAAGRVLDRCLSAPWESSASDLYGGLAGMGLNFAHLADAIGDTALYDAADRATRLVADRMGAVGDVAEVSGGDGPFAGLLHGSSGAALLFVRMYERTGEPGLVEQAAIALRQDLRRCVRKGDGHLHVDEGWRTMPYLAAGSVGIGLALRRYLAARPEPGPGSGRSGPDDDLVEAAAAIRGAACAPFYVQPGLFGGRAGMVLYLADGRPPGSPPDADTAAQVERLDWHALSYQGHLAFPGEQLLRLSTDLATGSAGVLLALGRALHDGPAHLPFLGACPVSPVCGSPSQDRRSQGPTTSLGRPPGE
jgi:hypothetical protein